MSKKPFNPTPSLIRSAENLLVTMALADQVRPVVVAYETAILAKHQFTTAERWKEHFPPRVVVDRKDIFLLDEADAQVFHADCFAARDAAGLKVERPDNCPLLEAETNQMQAENAFIAEIGTIPGLETFATKTYVLTLEQRAGVLKLGLGLLAPYVGSSESILQRILKGDSAPAVA